MQFFVHPTEMDKWFEYWKEERMKFYKGLYRKHDNLRFYEHPKDKLVFYAKKAFDIEYKEINNNMQLPFILDKVLN